MNVLIIAGGTGGHIFPALAFGDWLLRTKKASSVAYICGSRPLEIEIYRSAGIVPLILPTAGSPFGVSGFANKIKRVFGLINSCFNIRKILKQNPPDVCFLFGSYVSFPALVMCHLMKIPVVMHEQNSILGKVARLAKKLGHTVVNTGISGVPVRPLVQKKFDIDIPENLRTRKIIGVLGGSLASGTLTKILESVTDALPECLFLILADTKQSSKGNVIYIGRHWDMNPIFSTINLAVCRGGASTLAELAAYQIPSVVIPWEGAADGHQTENAKHFAEITGNSVWRESENVENLIEQISKICGNPEQYKYGFHDGASEALFRTL